MDVLVVEDNPADVELIRVIVEDAGLPHRLLAVPDGEAALAYLREATHPPRLMLLDLNLPRLGGLEVLEALRTEGRGVPTVVFTSSDAEQDRQGALALGAAAHVLKPVSFEALTRVLLEVLHEYAPLPVRADTEQDSA